MLIQKAMLNGIQNGRDGKGSVFVFASGNGAASGDQCNFDGYTNSIYSVTVAAVDVQGKHPYYSEPCAANMIVTYSSGGGNNIVCPKDSSSAVIPTNLHPSNSTRRIAERISAPHPMGAPPQPRLWPWVYLLLLSKCGTCIPTSAVLFRR